MWKILILTTDPTLPKWKSLEAKKKHILSAFQSGKGGEIWTGVDVQYVDTKPLILESRIDHSWLQNLITPYFEQGYAMVGFHTSEKQWKTWKIKSSLRGSNPNRSIELEDFYLSADEKSLRCGFDRFTQVFLHEGSHGYYDHSGKEDLTHTFHEANKDITPLLKTFNWTLWQPKRQNLKRQVSLLRQAVVFLKERLASKPQNVVLKNDLLPLVKRQADKVLTDMSLLGHPMRITQGYRSIEEQNKLYGQGRTYAGPIVTFAKGGESYHNFGVACDFIFRKEGYNASKELWQTFGAIGKRHGFEWGGDWKGFIDQPHLEMKLGHPLSSFQKGLVDLNKYK